jgi:hypothetical protein
LARKGLLAFIRRTICLAADSKVKREIERIRFIREVSAKGGEALRPPNRLLVEFPCQMAMFQAQAFGGRARPGVDFVRTIEQAVAACDVLIAVIGGRF